MCKDEFEKYSEKEEKSMEDYKTSDLKSIVTIRETNFAKQFRVLLRRYTSSIVRIPLAVFAIFGMGIFATFLVSSIYY